MTGQCPECHKFVTIEAQDKVVNTIIGKFKQRSDVGIKKYNTTLMRDDLSIQQWLDHAIEESMDFILYLTKIKLEIEKWEQSKKI